MSLPPRQWKQDNICGTPGDAGWRRHRRRGETPCDECREARNAYYREYNRARPRERSRRFENETPEAAERRKERARTYNAARQRAWARLGREYPDRFAELLAEERGLA
jgi:hypothetical protein